MKVSECRKCDYFKEGRYSIRHVPASGRAVGFTYRYGWCVGLFRRCLEVKKSECTRLRGDKE